MADDKIRISWEELSQAEVDTIIKRQELLARAQEHYVPATPAPAQLLAPPLSGKGLWFSTLLYMPLFGAIGGLIGWAAGEIVLQAIPDHLSTFQKAENEVKAVILKVERGQLTAESATRQIEEIEARYADNPYWQILVDPALNALPEHDSAQVRDARILARRPKDEFTSWLRQLLWFSVLGIGLSMCLSIADHAMARNTRSALINGSTGVALGALGGLIVGLFINHLYRAMLGDTPELARQILARGVGWAILGLFLAIAPGVVLVNWKRLLIGLAGGFLGGLVGGVLFDPIVSVIANDTFSRLVAIVAIGLVAGAGTGLIELATKTGWLRVTGGLIVGKQFVIYKNPTLIGSSPQCEIYLFKDPQVGPQHAAIHQGPGGFDIEDLRSPTGTFVNGQRVSRQRLRSHDQIQIGRTTLQFQERQRTQGAEQ